jgi:hypothetical protein
VTNGRQFSCLSAISVVKLFTLFVSYVFHHKTELLPPLLATDDVGLASTVISVSRRSAAEALNATLRNLLAVVVPFFFSSSFAIIPQLTSRLDLSVLFIPNPIKYNFNPT